MHVLGLSSIRRRLLVSYLGLIVGGLGLLALLMGGQMSRSARADFEQSLSKDIELIAHALTDSVRAYAQGTSDETQLRQAFAPYELRLGGQLELYFTGFERYQSANTDRFKIDIDAFPEIDGAILNGQGLVERQDASGQRRLYLAVSVHESSPEGDDSPLALLRLSVPFTRLDEQVRQQWLGVLALTCALTLCAALVSLALSASITRPLERLRSAALRLAQGDLSHRTPDETADELGAVGRAFNQMAEQLQHVLNEQRAFASNASHELRTPLTTIQLRLEALKQTDLTAPISRQYLNDIEGEIQRLTVLIQGLFLLSQMDAGKMELGKDLLDVGRFASAFIPPFEEQAQARRIALQLHKPAEALYVRVSVAHLSIVLRNLLENALKYTPEGGQVVWRIQSDGDNVLHCISDTGQGIAPDDVPRLFERFYRADKARSRQIAGTGLGLALVKSITEAYGGRISITSVGLGQGTQVRLWWQVASLDEEADGTYC